MYDQQHHYHRLEWLFLSPTILQSPTISQTTSELGTERQQRPAASTDPKLELYGIGTKATRTLADLSAADCAKIGSKDTVLYINSSLKPFLLLNEMYEAWYPLRARDSDIHEDAFSAHPVRVRPPVEGLGEISNFHRALCERLGKERELRPSFAKVFLVAQSQSWKAAEDRQVLVVCTDRDAAKQIGMGSTKPAGAVDSASVEQQVSAGIEEPVYSTALPRAVEAVAELNPGRREQSGVDRDNEFLKLVREKVQLSKDKVDGIDPKAEGGAEGRMEA